MTSKTKIFLLFFSLIAILLFGIGLKPFSNGSNEEKINGISFVSPSQAFDQAFFAIPKKQINANWVCIMPFGFIPEGGKTVSYNSEWQWWGEKKEGVSSMIEMAKAQNLKVMLKPQIWKRHGSYTGHHSYNNDDDWLDFESSYRQFILDFAKLAEHHQLPLFCIGTEWDYFVKERPQFWTKLIQEIKKVYSGKLTYAANWDEYKRVPFWEDLDYIGVDAYFPLSEEKNPSKEQLIQAWEAHKNHLFQVQKRFKKQILFTEYGYRSRDFSCKSPWESDRSGEVNLALQANAYAALYEVFWDKKEMAGGFIWKWFPDYEKSGGPNNNRFSPQRKPVEKVIREFYTSN